MKIIADLVRKPLAWAIGAFILIGIGWWLVSTVIGGASAKTEARLARNAAGAAIESGRDAVNTIGKQMASEDAIDIISRENEHEIRNAPGARAPVDPAARDAALRSLCRRAAYRERPECLQFAPAR